MTKWNRIHKSETHPIYVYERAGEYKAYAYDFFRIFKGEAALKDLLQYLNDFGYSITKKEIDNAKV